MVAPQVASVSTTVEGTTNANVPIPTGVVAGSLVLLFGMNASNAGLTPPVGFTEIVAEISAGPRAWAWWKRASGPESGTYTLSGGIAQNVGGFAMRIVDDDGTSTPFGLTDADRVGSQTTGPALDLATANAEALLVHMIAPSAGRQFTPETGFTGQSEINVNHRVGVMTKTQPTTGSTGTVDGAINTAATMAALLFAVDPGASNFGNVIVGGVKKTVTARSVIVGGAKKSVTSRSVIVGGVKKTIP